MGWSLGFDSKWNRDIGYGVPAFCDHPGCNAKIDRGLSFVCGSKPYGGEHGCGLYFCGAHLQHRQPRGSDESVANCTHCLRYRKPFEAKSDHPDWVDWKLTDTSWSAWRAANPTEVERMQHSIVRAA